MFFFFYLRLDPPWKKILDPRLLLNVNIQSVPRNLLAKFLTNDFNQKQELVKQVRCALI